MHLRGDEVVTGNQQERVYGSREDHHAVVRRIGGERIERRAHDQVVAEHLDAIEINRRAIIAADVQA